MVRQHTEPLKRGDLMPHFTVTTVSAARFDYSTIWQRRHLLLIVLPDLSSDAVAHYIAEIARNEEEVAAHDATCVITSDAIPRLSPPAVIVADRWSEIYFAANGRAVTDLPPATDILEWLRYVDHECPECQGEAR